MTIQVRRAEYQDVEAMRALYRQELNCQIIRDSFLPRGLADPCCNNRPATADFTKTLQ